MIARLETQRLILRKPVAADWPFLRDFAMSDRAVGVGGPMSEKAAARVFLAEVGHWDVFKCGMFIVTDKSDEATPLGLVGPWRPFDWPETEVGWMVFEGAEGRGIAFEAAQACVRHAYADLGWDTVVSYVGRDNTRSAKLATRLGAVLDENAAQPDPQNPCLVYRHPKEAA